MTECMVCYDEMTSSNTYPMACSHPVCVKCAKTMCTNAYTDRGPIETFHTVHESMKNSCLTRRFTEVNVLTLHSIHLKCPYCRQYDKLPLYNFNHIRNCVPSQVWNDLERNYYENRPKGMTFANKEGMTFAFEVEDHSMHIAWPSHVMTQMFYFSHTPTAEEILCLKTRAILRGMMEKKIYKRNEAKVSLPPYKKSKRYKMIR